MNKTCVVVLGRFSPVHLGHANIFQLARSFCNSTMNTEMKIFMSTSLDDEKNFLPIEQKLQMIHDCFPEYYQYCYSMPDNSLFATMTSLDSEYDNITLLCGSDRYMHFKNVLEKYNGTLYNFRELKVLDMGNREVSPYSSTAMKNAVLCGDFYTFSACLGGTKFDQKYYQILAEYMGVTV